MKKIEPKRSGSPGKMQAKSAGRAGFANFCLSRQLLVAMCLVLLLGAATGLALVRRYFPKMSEPSPESLAPAWDAAPLTQQESPSGDMYSSQEESAAESAGGQSAAESSEQASSEGEIELMQTVVEKPREEVADEGSPNEEYRAPDVPPPPPPPDLPDVQPSGESCQISMENILQDPELPTGCEITALTMALRYYGYDVSKETMADEYLPRSVDFSTVDGQDYGPDFRYYFAGNPYTVYGYGCLSPAIVTAANRYLSDCNGSHQAVNISGSSPSELYDCVKKGVPVVVWVTIGMREPYVSGGWYVQDTGEYLEWTSREHCVVLTGIQGDNVIINDPLAGVVAYSKDLFEERYNQLGCQAVILQTTVPDTPDTDSSSQVTSSQADSSSQVTSSQADSSSQVTDSQDVSSDTGSAGSSQDASSPERSVPSSSQASSYVRSPSSLPL